MMTFDVFDILGNCEILGKKCHQCFNKPLTLKQNYYCFMYIPWNINFYGENYTI